jgi:metal-responsive CopG/Arc/MetJ family transcriptional regulator
MATRLRNRRAYAIPSARTFSMYLNVETMARLDEVGAEIAKSRSEVVEAFIRHGLRAYEAGSKEARRTLFE